MQKYPNARKIFHGTQISLLVLAMSKIDKFQSARVRWKVCVFDGRMIYDFSTFETKTKPHIWSIEESSAIKKAPRGPPDNIAFGRRSRRLITYMHIFNILRT